MKFVKNKDTHKTEVIVKGKVVGNVRKFCCGIDFRHAETTGYLFSILKVHKMPSKELKECIRAIMKLHLPKPKNLVHMNFHPNDKDELLSYQQAVYKNANAKKK